MSYTEEERLEKKRAGIRAWREANKERVSASNKALRERKKLNPEWLARERERWALQNAKRSAELRTPEAIAAKEARAAARAEAKKSDAEVLDRRRSVHRKWCAENRDKRNRSAADYRARNAARLRSVASKNRAARLLRRPAWLTECELWMLEEAHDLAELRGRMCGGAWEVDHIVPLQGKTVSGLDVPWNVRVLRMEQNRRKYNKLQEPGVCETWSSWRTNVMEVKPDAPAA